MKILTVIFLLTHTPKNSDSVVFDPFLGSGSTGRTSLLLGYKFVGVELYKENIKTAKRVLHEGESIFNQEALDQLLVDCGVGIEEEVSLAA
jgi:hypothetical protein